MEKQKINNRQFMNKRYLRIYSGGNSAKTKINTRK